MKKIVITLSIILAFAMFNSSAKAFDCQIGIVEEIYSDCDCYGNQCYGYRWYQCGEVCSTGTCDDDGCHNCRNLWDYPNLHAHVAYTEYECFTPRFGCQGEGLGEGEECNEFFPMQYYYLDHWKHCVCLPT